MGMFRHSINKCLDSTTAVKEHVKTNLNLNAKTKLANVFGGYNQSMAFAA